jgi:mRNA interferase MazF
MIAGDVVLLRFPFSDLSGAKLRPAVVLAVVDASDFIACQITSQRRGRREQIELTVASFDAGGLRRTSYVVPAKLFTAERRIIVRRVGRVKDGVRDTIREAVCRVIRGR